MRAARMQKRSPSTGEEALDITEAVTEDAAAAPRKDSVVPGNPTDFGLFVDITLGDEVVPGSMEHALSAALKSHSEFASPPPLASTSVVPDSYYIAPSTAEIQYASSPDSYVLYTIEEEEEEAEEVAIKVVEVADTISVWEKIAEDAAFEQEVAEAEIAVEEAIVAEIIEDVKQVVEQEIAKEEAVVVAVNLEEKIAQNHAVEQKTVEKKVDEQPEEKFEYEDVYVAYLEVTEDEEIGLAYLDGYSPAKKAPVSVPELVSEDDMVSNTTRYLLTTY
jgi:hypothetical protein